MHEKASLLVGSLEVDNVKRLKLTSLCKKSRDRTLGLHPEIAEGLRLVRRVDYPVQVLSLRVIWAWPM